MDNVRLEPKFVRKYSVSFSLYHILFPSLSLSLYIYIYIHISLSLVLSLSLSLSHYLSLSRYLSLSLSLSLGLSLSLSPLFLSFVLLGTLALLGTVVLSHTLVLLGTSVLLETVLVLETLVLLETGRDPPLPANSTRFQLRLKLWCRLKHIVTHHSQPAQRVFKYVPFHLRTTQAKTQITGWTSNGHKSTRKV